MTKKTARDYIQEISTWSDYNFPPETHAPDIGIVEEIGEIAHCILKHLQKIRGFENEEYFLEQIEDAFADAAVYLMHYCGKNKLTFSFLPSVMVNLSTGRQYFCYILRNVIPLLDYTEKVSDANMMEIAQFPAQRIWNALAGWANQYNLDLVQSLEKTWNKVRQRDWKNNPKNADKVNA